MANLDVQFALELPAPCLAAPIAYVEVQTEIWEHGRFASLRGMEARSAFFDARPWLGRSDLAGGARSARARFAKALPKKLELLRWDALPGPAGGWGLAILLKAPAVESRSGSRGAAGRAAEKVLASLGAALGDTFSPVVLATRMICRLDRGWSKDSLIQVGSEPLAAAAARLEEKELAGGLAPGRHFRSGPRI